MSTPNTDAVPAWPVGRIDPAQVNVDDDPPSDELTVYVRGKPVASNVDPIGAPGNDFAAIMIGLDPDESSAGEIVGIQVMPFLSGAVRQHPKGAILAWGSGPSCPGGR